MSAHSNLGAVSKWAKVWFSSCSPRLVWVSAPPGSLLRGNTSQNLHQKPGGEETSKPPPTHTHGSPQQLPHTLQQPRATI